MLHAVIMAGGSGTRFWPQSREKMPKQLLQLSSDRTMIQQTIDRCDGLIEPDHSWIVTNAIQVVETCNQLPEIPSENVLVEPLARNTAPCVGLAAIHALHRDPDATMLIMPADHVISTAEDFQNAVQQAAAVVEAQPERLVMFGITPAFPATGFGYVERGSALPDVGRAFEVVAFHEKPQLQTAEDYVASGRFYWNCGIFCWKAQTILNQLQQHENDTYLRLQRIARSIGEDSYAQVLGEEFPLMNSISIDCAVLERATGATIIEAPFSWDDVGSWLAVPRLADQDDSGNTIDGAFVGIDTNDCIVRTSENHLVATLGVSDLIIVQTADATLVAHKRDSERIKELLAQLKEQGRSNYL
ncbi:MAG TPA: mannose-1-phosphate guanyltransferase [Planctomycetes bacterium]|nr:mannose-1-phosphate guanyltransferase [Planctomycetota bacterium]